MYEPTYTKTLAASWKLAWRHKGLWAFGLFAMLLGQLGIMELLVKAGVAHATIKVGGIWHFFVLLFRPSTWAHVSAELAFGPAQWVWWIWLIIMLVGLLAALVFVAVVCQGAIVYAAAKDVELLSSYPDERKAWHEGVRHFWRVLFLNICRKLVLFATAFVVIWAAIARVIEPGAMNDVLFMVAFFATAVVGMVLSLLLVYAVGYVVIEEYSVGKALFASWKLFRAHILVSFEVGLILLFMNVAVVVLLIAGLVYIFFLPVVVTTSLASFFGGVALVKAGVGFGYMLFLVYAMTLGAVFTVFVTSVWTYLFTKMHKHGVSSRVLHYIGLKK